MSSSSKSLVIELANKMGFHQVSIGSLSPLAEEGKVYAEWLSRGYEASMDYMRRNQERRLDPGQVLNGSKSVILATVSYYTEKPPPKPLWGSIARYAVGLDYHAVFRKKMRDLRDALSKELGFVVEGKPFIDSYPFLEQGLASRHGLGFIGKNSLIITPKLAGSYCFIGELFVDFEIEPDGPYLGTCGKCFRCGVDCPTDAIPEAGLVDSNLCISYLTIENKGPIPRELRNKIGDWVFGCDICQEVCPYNQRPLPTPWKELEPHSGAGHYLDLLSVLSIPDDVKFQDSFGTTALRRPKRRGIIRNALVVLGNHINELANGSKRWQVSPKQLADALEAVIAFAKEETDPLLREHAYWALTQAGSSSVQINIKEELKTFCLNENEADNKLVLEEYLQELSS